MSRAPTDAPLVVRDVLVIPTTFVEGDYPDAQRVPTLGGSND